MESKITEEGIHVDTSIEAFADIKRHCLAITVARRLTFSPS
jgi:hypothetical protein